MPEEKNKVQIELNDQHTIIRPSGIKLPDRPLPLTFNFHNKEVLGRLEEFKVSEGKLEAIVVWDPEKDRQQQLDSGSMELSPGVQMIEYDEQLNGCRIITKCRLLEVSVTFKRQEDA